MATLAEIRQQHPEYGDMSDTELTDRLHSRHYADMPRDEFNKRIGYKPPTSGETVADAARQTAIGFNRGFDNLLNLPGDVLLRAPARLLGLESYVPQRGSYATRFNPGGTFNFSSEPTKGATPRTTVGRYAGQVGEALGASALPTAGVVATAPRLANLVATTVPRAIGRQIGTQVAANPVGAVGADILAATGSGVAQQAAGDAGGGPIAQTIAGVAGGVAPFAVPAVAARARQAVEGVRANADPYARVVAGLGDTSVDDLTIASAVGATGNDAAVGRRAMTILGEEMVRAVDAPNAQLQAAIARIEADVASGRISQAVGRERTQQAQGAAAWQASTTRMAAEDGITPDAAAGRLRGIRAAQAESDLMLGEYPGVAGSNMATRNRRPENVLDADAGRATESGAQQLIDYVANASSMASAQGVRNAVTDRAAQLGDRTRALVQGLAPDVNVQQPNGRVIQRPGTIHDVEDIVTGMQVQSRADYAAAHARGAVNQGVLYAGLNRAITRAIARLRGRGGEVADALRRAVDSFYVTQPAGIAEREAAAGQQRVLSARMAIPILQDDLAATRLAINEARRQRAGRDVIDQMARQRDDIVERLRLARRDATTATGRSLPTSLQVVQDARTELRGTIQRLRAANDHSVANALQELYDDVTNVMQVASPQWGVANRRWADMALNELAVELGDTFVKGAGPRARAQMRQFAQLAPEAQDVVRIHFVQRMLDDIEHEVRLNGQANLGKLFTREDRRRMIRQILGDQAAVAVARLVRDADVMAGSRNMLRGSQTHQRGQVQREQDADIQAMAAAANFDWRNWREAAMERLMALWREQRNRTMGRIITTPMRNVHGIAENLERMRQAAARVERAQRPMAPPALPWRGVVAPAINPLMRD